MISYNYTALHAAPLFQALADQAIVREALGTNDFNISAEIDPLPLTSREQGISAAQSTTLAWMLVVFSFPFIGGSFAAFIVTERESKAKHLQTVAGVQPVSYWLSSFLWDSSNYLIPMALVVIMVLGFDVVSLTKTEDGQFYAMLVILFLYGTASASFAYCVSFAFSSPILCSITLIIVGIMIGIAGPIVVFILEIFANIGGSSGVKNAARILPWTLRAIPSFDLGNGLWRIINLNSIKTFEKDTSVGCFDTRAALFEMIMLGVCTVAYLILAVFLDILSTNPAAMKIWNGIFKCQFAVAAGARRFNAQAAVPDDDDVIEEQNRVNRGEANGDLIVLDQMTKIYDSGKIAVNGMSLGIPHGQCFGLLGINGAGKVRL